jgi:hypothetical protein
MYVQYGSFIWSNWNRQLKSQPVRFFIIIWIEIDIEIDPAMRRTCMAHNHGYEYRIRIILDDGTEELSEWMNSTDQVAQTIISFHKLQRKTCWLLARNIICPNCTDREHVLEYPIIDIPSPQYIPYDSRRLRAMDSKNRYALGFSS